MSDNRFEFLEIGESVSSAPNTAADPDSLAPPNLASLWQRQPDEPTLAEVRVEDQRGYQALIAQAESETAVTSPAVRRGNGRARQGGLRAAEVFGERGSQAGQFNFPNGLAVDARGVVYIADSYNHRIQRITPTGEVAVIGGRGAGRMQFLLPQAVAVDGRQAFYVVEQGNHRVQKYSGEGVLELVFGRHGAREGELHGPTGIAVAPGTGDIFVADTGNSRVQRFDAYGRFLSLIGAAGGLYPPLVSPQALAVDSGDTLYVADTLSHRVMRYDPLGRLVGQYGGTPNRFYEPRAVACDAAGLLYVADNSLVETDDLHRQGRLWALEPDRGDMVFSVERLRRGLGTLNRPGGVAVGPSVHTGTIGSVTRGDVYVADTMNHRILRFVWD